MANDIYTAQRNAMDLPIVNGIRAIIYKEARKIAAPQLQTKFKGNKNIPQLFEVEFWVTEKSAPKETPIMSIFTHKQWEQIALKWKQDSIANKPKNELSKLGPVDLAKRWW